MGSVSAVVKVLLQCCAPRDIDGNRFDLLGIEHAFEARHNSVPAFDDRFAASTESIVFGRRQIDWRVTDAAVIRFASETSVEGDGHIHEI